MIIPLVLGVGILLAIATRRGPKPVTEFIPGTTTQVLSNDQLVDFVNARVDESLKRTYLLIVQRDRNRSDTFHIKEWQVGNTVIDANASNDLNELVRMAKELAPLTITTILTKTIDGEILYQWHNPAYPDPNQENRVS